ncbi:MAG: type II toxin-antitoxin system RelE/ParE family toxin [Alphaproteobacteria bacterium]|nr:type II toxin-antitoxin system RelE/ParE family toxin [Alphaproteobacteria bacterium]
MKIRYTRPALADLDSILDYIAQREPQGARRVQGRISEFINLLSSHPLMGTRTDDASVRRLAIVPYSYLVFYGVTPDAIIIHAVRHMARNPSSMPGSA